MTRTAHRSLLGALAVSVALLAAACGTSSGSDDAGKDDPTTTAAKATTTTEAEAGDDAQARAESIDLTESDFPEGFTASPASEDEGEPGGIEQCTGEPVDDDVTGEYTTDDFTAGDLNADDGVQVSVKTKVFTDEAAAEAALEPFTDPEVISCIDDLFKEQFTGSTNTVEGSISIQDYGDTTADQAELVGGRFTVTTADGQEVPLSLAVVVWRTGDVATQLVATGVGPSIDDVDLAGVGTRIEELQADA